MSHRIIIGSTGSGKTYMAKAMVDDFIASHNRVVIFNPLNQNFNQSAERYTHPDNFYEAIFNANKDETCYIVVDEVSMLIAHDKKRFDFFMVRARHHGSMLMLVQRPQVVLSQTVLSQCNEFIIFHLGVESDRKFIAKNTGLPLEAIKALDKTNHEYLYSKI